MNKNEFKKILLKTAVCAIASDGKIDDKEIKALYHIEKESKYFSSFEMKDFLDSYLKKCMNDINKYTNQVFNSIKKSKLTPFQELIILEISLRIIAADNIEEKEEEAYMINLRNNLSIDDLLISERFGTIKYLGITRDEVNQFNEFNQSTDLETDLGVKK